MSKKSAKGTTKGKRARLHVPEAEVRGGNFLTAIAEKIIDNWGGKSPETIMNEAVNGNRGSASGSSNTYEG